MATQNQINTVAANIVATVPTNAAIPQPVIISYVAKLLNDLDVEVVAQATFVAQNAEKKPKH